MRIKFLALCAAVCLVLSGCKGETALAPTPVPTPTPTVLNTAPAAPEPTKAQETPSPSPAAQEPVVPTPIVVPETVTDRFLTGQKEGAGTSAQETPDFVLVGEAVPDAILEIRYYSSYNFVGQRIDGYEEPVALLTREAAAALKEVSDDVMERGYRLKIYDAYRPQDAVSHFVRWAEDLEDVRMKPWFYPEKDKSVLFDEGYIARRSSHSRGSTVDLTLFDMETGKEVDMGGTFDYFGSRSHPDYTGDLTQAQTDARALLRKVMTDHGFKPISTEWWHFTLKEEPYPETYFNLPVSEKSAQS